MAKKILKVFLFIIGGLVLIIMLLVIFLAIISPGKTEKIIDPSGNYLDKSISKIEKIKLGGVYQYFIIRGADSTKSVMLFLHGGPGSPEIAFMRKTNQKIENDFVMVYWEQRGSGKSYSSDIPTESMNVGQLIADTRELSAYLARRFQKEKIYIMGHSWGSLLGMMTVDKHPDLFYAYFGIGQVAHQYRGERISFDWVKEQAHRANDANAIESLAKLSFPDSTAANESWNNFIFNERRYVMKFGGGVTHDMRSFLPVVTMIFGAKEYTLSEKFNFMKGSLFSTEHLWPTVINTNLFNDIDSIKIPVYIFQGIHDYQTPYIVAKEFFDQLKAPKKGFYTFENSAHSPCMEEVDKFNSIVKEIANQN